MKPLKESFIKAKDLDNLKNKYVLTNETLNLNGHTLHRIQALKNIPSIKVKKGDLGGWIESYDNLDQKGDCWVANNAQVYRNAKVYGDALVYNDAVVYRDAEVYDNAQICGNAYVYNNAKVYENAWVYGHAWVYGNAQVYGEACVYGDAQVFNNAKVYGNARVDYDVNKGTIEK